MLAAVVAFSLLNDADRVVAGARGQLAVPARYDASYRAMAYPNGDVPWDRGACTDVVVRSLRAAGVDLQRLIHEDRASRGLPTDRNIDHRRVKSQAGFLRRQGRSLSLSGDWRPGDIVCWVLDSGLDHTGIVSSRRGESGSLMVVHNLSVTKEEDVLEKWRIAGHYRFP
jgi:uncharacterized protein YijF (DUF1287 family)